MPQQSSDDDESRPRDGRRGEPIGQFLIGAIGGSFCSFVFWPLVFYGSWGNGNGIGTASVAFVFVKLGLGMGFLVMRDRRPLGLGILLSIGVGGLILAGTCFAAVATAPNP